MSYELGRLFRIRSAGAAFDVLHDLATPELFELARQLLADEQALATAAKQAYDAVAGASSRDDKVARDVLRALSKQRAVTDPRFADQLATYHHALETVAAERKQLADRVEPEEDRAREIGWQHGLALLPDFVVFESAEMFSLLALRADDRSSSRSKDRKQFKSVALYLQRICSKNETFSRFGPGAWGRIDDTVTGVRLTATPEIVQRRTFPERWVVTAIVRAMRADAETKPELCPRRHPSGRLDGDVFLRHDTGESTQLDAAQRAVFDRCDGNTPACRLDTEVLAVLEARGVVIWTVETVAMVHDGLDRLREVLRRWREGDVKARWLGVLDDVIATCRDFASADASGRAALNERLVAAVTALGARAPEPVRTLYAARNPIGEECIRDIDFVLGRDIADRVVADAAPWFDLFRDTFAFATSHAFGRLLPLFEAAPRHGGVLSYASFSAYCEANGLSFRDAAYSKLGSEAYRIVRDEFTAALAGREDAPEWQITADDCHCIRRNHSLKHVEGWWPSADIQIAAKSVDDVAAGRYEMILAELHTAGAMFQHAGVWYCPDRIALRRMFEGYFEDKPWLHMSRRGFEGPVHTNLSAAFELMRDPTFVAPELPDSSWPTVAPADTIVVADADEHDIRVTTRDGRNLGSLIRNPFLTLGWHPFFPFSRVPHAPRLRLGNTIVQRRTWTVTQQEVGPVRLEGLDADRVVAIEKLRASRGLPRWVYSRPSEGVLLRSSTYGRDKDVKPMLIDLESYNAVTVFLRRLEKFTELEVVEMRPSPDELLWSESDGHRCFELRTLVRYRA